MLKYSHLRGEIMTSEILTLIDQNQEKIISFLKELVRIPSMTGKEKECGKLILQKLCEIGIDAEVYEAEPGRPNIVASYKGALPGKVFHFNGHMDVVPPGDRSEWDRDPFSADEMDGWIYGRGTVDMKSGLVAMIMAVDFLKRSKIDLAGDISLTIVSDEQWGGAKGTRYLLDKGVVKGDFGISGESTNMKIEVATKGIFQAEITTLGKSAHSGRPWFGIDAIQKMADLLIEFRELDENLRRREHPLVGPASLTVGMIDGGCATNMVASSCSIKVDRRFLPHETEESIKKELEEVFLKIKKEDENFRWKFTPTLFFPGMYISPDEFIVRAISKAFKEVRGVEPEIGGKLGGTDAAWIYHRLGIPLVHFSAGETNKGGTSEEKVKPQDVIDATKIYALTVLYALNGF
jgi:acetylornithine deacetylase/succinyl-diaminopimelate desuccinylase family protein